MGIKIDADLRMDLSMKQDQYCISSMSSYGFVNEAGPGLYLSYVLIAVSAVLPKQVFVDRAECQILWVPMRKMSTLTISFKN